MRLLVCGPEGVGKSTFCFSFSKYLQKRGLSCEVVNLDPRAKRLKYEPVANVRKHASFKDEMKRLNGSYERAIASCIERAFFEKSFSQALAKPGVDVLLIDSRAPLEYLILGDSAELLSVCDSILYIVDSHSDSISLIEAALKQATGKPVFVVLNKEDVSRKEKGLGRFSQTHSFAKISSIEKSGFAELASTLGFAKPI